VRKPAAISLGAMSGPRSYVPSPTTSIETEALKPRMTRGRVLTCARTRGEGAFGRRPRDGGVGCRRGEGIEQELTRGGVMNQTVGFDLANHPGGAHAKRPR
jgi:hypothetical protein